MTCLGGVKRIDPYVHVLDGDHGVFVERNDVVNLGVAGLDGVGDGAEVDLFHVVFFRDDVDAREGLAESVVHGPVRQHVAVSHRVVGALFRLALGLLTNVGLEKNAKFLILMRPKLEEY